MTLERNMKILGGNTRWIVKNTKMFKDKIAGLPEKSSFKDLKNRVNPSVTICLHAKRLLMNACFHFKFKSLTAKTNSVPEVLPLGSSETCLEPPGDLWVTQGGRGSSPA